MTIRQHLLIPKDLRHVCQMLVQVITILRPVFEADIRDDFTGIPNVDMEVACESVTAQYGFCMALRIHHTLARSGVGRGYGG